MKKLLLCLALLVPSAWAQSSGFITSTQCFSATASGLTQGAYSITGTWTGTITAYGVVGQGAQVSLGSQTTDGSYTVSVSGYTLFQVCGNSVGSGAAFVQVYTSIPTSSSSGSSLPTGTIAPGIVQIGLLAQYDFNQGSGTVLTDKSGNGNNGTLCAAGAAPTWVANTGGLQFVASSSQCVTLPSALNASKTIQIFINYQQGNIATSSAFPTALIAGNGTAANTAALIFEEGGGTNVGFPNETGTNPFALQPRINPVANGAGVYTTASGFAGTGMVSWVLDASSDQIYFNQYGPIPCTTTNCTGGSQGTQTAGVYQLGGRAAGYLNSNSSFWTGIQYYALFYNVELTAAQIAQNYQAVSTALAQRGVLIGCVAAGENCPLTNNPNNTGVLPAGLGSYYSTTGQNVLMSTGDSEDAANGGYFYAMTPSLTYGNWLPVYISTPGRISPTNPGSEPLETCMYASPTGFNVDHVWWGQNEPGGTGFIQRQAAHTQLLRQCGFKIILASQLSCNCAGQATNNNLVRQFWPQIADAYADLAASPSLGATAASTNTTYFPDGLHLTPVGQNVAAGIWQKALNRNILGNFSFSTGNTYTATAATATAITAATESTNTVTLTFGATPASFVVGSDVYVTGVTPAGYNTTSADTICHVLTRTATTITCINPNASLGAGTVFGTAGVATQLDQDMYVTLAGSATSPVFTLETCQGITDSKVYIKNANTTSPWVIESEGQFSGAFTATETIDGANTLTMPTASSGSFPVVILQAKLIAVATGGCTWARLQ